MLIQQTPLYLEFFGYPELAKSVRSDDRYLLDLITPEALRRGSNTAASAETIDIPA
jgi:shikimate dehydrogenase